MSMSDDYIYARCKCGRTVRGLKEYLRKGISCPDCGALVRAKYDDKEQAQKETPEEPEQPIVKKPADSIPATDKCPSCNITVNIDYRKKYLAYCSTCSKMFIRSQKPDPEDATDDDSTIRDNASNIEKKQEKNTISGTMPGEMQDNVKAMTPNAPETVDANTNSGSSESQGQVPKAPQNQNDKDESSPVPPSEKQIALLQFLNIGGITASSNELSNILLTITTIVEDAVREYNASFHFFPVAIKMEIIYNIIKSPYFPGIYFGDRDIKYEELQPFIDDAIKDIELKKAMKIYVPDESFILAGKYISGFCDYIFNTPIDPDILKVLTLKSFIRGFGPKLQPFSNVLYDNKAGTRNISEQEKHNYRLFFRKKTSTNACLEILLNEYGFKRPEKEKISHLGCLIYFTPLSLPAILYFIL